MNLFKYACAVAIVAIAGAISPSQAAQTPGTGNTTCDTQFNTCIANGTPTYKCTELYDLCLGTLNVTGTTNTGTLDERKTF